jgi:hypothetical protein
MRLLGSILVVTLLVLSSSVGCLQAGQCRHKAGDGPATAALPSADIDIKVSPHVIVLESEGEWITVHTNIAFGSVDTSSVSLNGVPAALTKADLRGNLVAKFTQTDIKAIVAPPETLLELRGLTTGGEEFSGSETVEVR